MSKDRRGNIPRALAQSAIVYPASKAVEALSELKKLFICHLGPLAEGNKLTYYVVITAVRLIAGD